MSNEIIERKIDSKGRVILPIKDKERIFIKQQDDLLILSVNKSKLESFSKEMENTAKILKLKRLKEWFLDINELGLDKLSVKDLKSRLDMDSKRIYNKKMV